jgi:hypothetical protein
VCSSDLAALRRESHDDPDLSRAAEGHHDERSEGRLDTLGCEEIEGLFQRDIESDTDDFHAAKRGLKSLWISL